MSISTKSPLRPSAGAHDALVHLSQTRRTNCGQTCVAMLVGHPLYRIEAMSMMRLIGMGKTTATELRDLLEIFGKKTTRSFVTRTRKSLESQLDRGPFILKVRERGGKGTHWVVWDDMLIYDPERQISQRMKWWLNDIERSGWKVTSIFGVFS